MKKILFVITCLFLVIVFGNNCFSAEKVAIVVKSSDEGMKTIAYNSVANFFKKNGFEVAEGSTDATKIVEINIEKTWAHRAVPPTVILIGGILDFFLYDCGHAQIQIIVKDSDGKEIFNGSELGTSCDYPVFSWLKSGKKHEKQALNKAIGSLLKKSSK